MRERPPKNTSTAGARVHLAAPDVQFPRYDFFRDQEPALQQQRQVKLCLEARKNAWRGRLEAMLYSTELSLSLRFLPSLPVAEQGAVLLCFAGDGERDGAMMPGPALVMEHAYLYQLAEMTFGGRPGDQPAPPRRPVSETERRLGLSLLSLFGQDLLTLLVPGCTLSGGRMLPLAQCEPPATLVEVELSLHGRQMRWYLLLPALAAPAENPDLIEVRRLELAEALRDMLPQLKTRLSIPLAECELSLGELAGLKEGDILPISLFHEATARVGEQPLLKGRVAEQQGMLVFASHGFID